MEPDSKETISVGPDQQVFIPPFEQARNEFYSEKACVPFPSNAPPQLKDECVWQHAQLDSTTCVGITEETSEDNGNTAKVQRGGQGRESAKQRKVWPDLKKFLGDVRLWPKLKLYQNGTRLSYMGAARSARGKAGKGERRQLEELQQFLRANHDVNADVIKAQNMPVLLILAYILTDETKIWNASRAVLIEACVRSWAVKKECNAAGEDGEEDEELESCVVSPKGEEAGEGDVEEGPAGSVKRRIRVYEEMAREELENDMMRISSGVQTMLIMSDHKRTGITLEAGGTVQGVGGKRSVCERELKEPESGVEDAAEVIEENGNERRDVGGRVKREKKGSTRDRLMCGLVEKGGVGDNGRLGDEVEDNFRMVEKSMAKKVEMYSSAIRSQNVKMSSLKRKEHNREMWVRVLNGRVKGLENAIEMTEFDMGAREVEMRRKEEEVRRLQEAMRGDLEYLEKVKRRKVEEVTKLEGERRKLEVLSGEIKEIGEEKAQCLKEAEHARMCEQVVRKLMANITTDLLEYRGLVKRTQKAEAPK